MAKNTTIHVRSNHEYGIFFVEEADVVPRETGGVEASATWTSYSSFGVFGYHWNSMGEPFGQFIREISEDYLLGKIGRKLLDSRKMFKSVQAEIIKRRRAKSISSIVAKEAIEELKSLSEAHEGEVLAHEIYINDLIHATGIDLCACESLEWDGQALQFVRKLWPKFVEAFNKQTERRDG